MNLFQLGNHTLASGLSSLFKIECDALTVADWEAAAWMVALRVEPFSEVEGVPTGGWPFAAAMEKYVTPDANQLLIVDDVWTTGLSMRNHRQSRLAIGAVLFARNMPAPWVTPIFSLSSARDHA